MGKEESIPGFTRKMEMLTGGRASKAALSKEGRVLASRGILDEALHFFAKAEDSAGMESLLEECRQRGDTFTFEAVLRALGRPATREEWGAVGAQALAAGQLWFAYRAFEKAGDQSTLDKVRQTMSEEGFAPIR